jgi:hypothetical protein
MSNVKTIVNGKVWPIGNYSYDLIQVPAHVRRRIMGARSAIHTNPIRRQPLIKPPDSGSMLPGLHTNAGLFQSLDQPKGTVTRRDFSGIAEQSRSFVDLIALHIRFTEVDNSHSDASSGM